MDTMLMAIFGTVPQALKGVITLRDLDRAEDITLHATAVLAKDPSGTVSIRQASERELNTAFLGLLSGVLPGALGGPVGLVLGGSVGGLIGLIFDLAKAGISADFLEESAKALPPGKAALIAEVNETLTDLVDTKLWNLGGHVCRWQRSEFVESKIIHELDAINAESTPTRAATGGKAL